jgi:diguanylate cyclase (GGDEF)-like protein
MRNGIQAREKEILRLAYEDGLTGLPNRAMFQDRLDHAIKLTKRTNHPFSILMMDLDRFKYVNDTLGHHVGDQVLSEVGRHLKTVVRESDTVARLGGDEFAVLLQNTNAEHLRATAQKILQALEKPIVRDGHALDVGTSIGVANFSELGDDPNLLMRRADMAMYVAKRTKCGYAIFDQCHDEHRQEHLSMLSELRHAVENDQLRLCYQPKINLREKRVTGVEALLRWEHHTRGLVAPGYFIPFAEQTGFIR